MGCLPVVNTQMFPSLSSGIPLLPPSCKPISVKGDKPKNDPVASSCVGMFAPLLKRRARRVTPSKKVMVERHTFTIGSYSQYYFFKGHLQVGVIIDFLKPFANLVRHPRYKTCENLCIGSLDQKPPKDLS